MSAKNTTIYIFVVFSDVRRLEILVSVSLRRRSFFLRKIVLLALVLAIVKQILFFGGCNHDGWNAAEYIFHTLKLASRFPHLISVLVLVSFLFRVTNFIYNASVMFIRYVLVKKTKRKVNRNA